MIHRHFGIDIASKTLQVCYLFNKEALQKSFKNNDKGWQLLLEWARQVCPKGQLRFCAEHTGGYEVGCVEFLQSQGVYVSVVDPVVRRAALQIPP